MLFHIFSDLQGLRESGNMELGKMNLIMGNRRSSHVTKIGVYSIKLSSGLCLELNNCCYSSEMTRNIIYFHDLYGQGFRFSFNNEISCFNSYYNGLFYFEALPYDGVYESRMVVDK